MKPATLNLPRQLYFEVASSFEPQNEWSLADYKRRVSPIATIEAWYETPSLRDMISSMTIASKFHRAEGNLGFAAGGRMYDSPHLRLSIVLLTLNGPERRKYIKTKILPGYDVVAF